MIYQNKAKSILTIIFFFLSFFSLMYAQGISINSVYANTSSNQSIQNSQEGIQHNILLTNILANNLGNRLNQSGSILEITANLPQVRNISFAHLLNQTLDTLHGIPPDADIEKRQVAQHILSHSDDFQIIIFIMPNGDIYFDEPYSRQQISTTTNLGFRDYFQGVIRTNDTYLGDVSASASSGQRQSVIAVPVYSLEDNSTLVGVWAGGLDFDALDKELQSLNLTLNNKRVVYTDDNGQKVADSNIDKSVTTESFANLASFKAAIDGQAGSTVDMVDNTNMLITYKPVKVFQNTFVVLLMQANNSNIN